MTGKILDKGYAEGVFRRQADPPRRGREGAFQHDRVFRRLRSGSHQHGHLRQPGLARRFHRPGLLAQVWKGAS